MTGRKAEIVVDAILADLSDRGGIGNELDQIRYGDKEAWDDMRETLIAIVLANCPENPNA